MGRLLGWCGGGRRDQGGGTYADEGDFADWGGHFVICECLEGL